MKIKFFAQTTMDSWYSDLKFYLTHGTTLEHLDPKKRRELRLRYAPFQIINDVLFRKKIDGVLLRCLEKDESEKVLNELHSGNVGGHFGGKTTAHKFLRAGYYWPTLFRDAHDMAHKCVTCQKVAGKVKKLAFPLQPVTIDQPFQQWGLDVIGPINLASSLQHKYILTTMDYFTRWYEAIPLRVVNTNQVISFLETQIISRFGIPESLVFDNASYFSSMDLNVFSMENGIKLKYYTSYYPQGNGLIESTNKNLIKILKRIVSKNHKNWHTALFYALWVDRVTPKTTIGNSPLFLVYGREVILPPNVFLPSLQLAKKVQEEECHALESRINALLKLEETRTQAKRKMDQHQQMVKRWFEKSYSTDRNFDVGDLVLRWDKAHEEKGNIQSSRIYG
jgi:hypothetical protein